MLVKDCMSNNPWTIDENRSINDARNMMMEHKVRRLPVMGGGILMGIITKEDILAASPSVIDFRTTDEIKKHLEETYVASVMTEDPYTVDAEAPIESAALIMAEKKIGSLPVLSGGKLTGLITETDVFRAFVKIMGLAEDSERKVVELDRGEATIENLLSRLKAKGRRVLSLFTYPSKSADKVKVLVRLEKTS